MVGLREDSELCRVVEIGQRLVEGVDRLAFARCRRLGRDPCVGIVLVNPAKHRRQPQGDFVDGLVAGIGRQSVESDVRVLVVFGDLVQVLHALFVIEQCADRYDRPVRSGEAVGNGLEADGHVWSGAVGEELGEVGTDVLVTFDGGGESCIERAHDGGEHPRQVGAITPDDSVSSDAHHSPEDHHDHRT